MLWIIIISIEYFKKLQRGLRRKKKKRGRLNKLVGLWKLEGKDLIIKELIGINCGNSHRKERVL